MDIDPTSMTPPESDPDQTQAEEREGSAHERRFPCAACGARLVFAPGTTTLTCGYCGAVNEIEDGHTEIRELDFRTYLERLTQHADTVDRIVSHCEKCGAEVEMPDNVTSHACPFCGSEVVATGRSAKLIKPGAVLPFTVTRDAARAGYRKWIGKRWFAPSDLKNNTRIENRLTGVYLPFWTYDSDTATTYTGKRGEYYYVSVPYTTMVNGKPQVRTRRERRTRWYPASGIVRNEFDDLLVAASISLPADMIREAGPWDLRELRPYTDEYLAGFRAESYAVGLPDGFAHAEQLMQPTIDRTIRQDIGGDTQQISTKSMHHNAITFKHVLLPVWMCAYRYQDRLYQVIVNAQTGEVVGDRPYSVWKIVAASLGVLLLIAAFILLVLMLKGR